MRKNIFFTVLLLFAVVYAFAQPVTITPPSATIQPGESVTLTASGALYYTWSPATGLSTTEGPVTVASPTVTTTYTCSGFDLGEESVVNGNFDQGNVGFNSDYQYNSNLWDEGTYYVDYDASLHHSNFHGLGHGGTGNFMIVNGATTPGTHVWTEQISVVPNTYYAFSTWVSTIGGSSSQVALLQFSINGNQLGDIFSAPASQYTWEQFYELWYSGNSTSATITILNQNTGGDGNDFGLDDISFCELVVVGAPQCTVYVGSMSASATADDTELCEGGSTVLHALPVNGSGNYTFSWTPANTLDDPTSQHPVATPAVGHTTYSCLIEDVGWSNTVEVGVGVVVHPTYDETVVDAAICYGESYNFYGTNYSQSGQFPYTEHSIYGCDSIIRLNLTVYPPNDTTVVDAEICIGEAYEFHGSWYDQDGQIVYFDTLDNQGCLKVEKLVLAVGEYQMPAIQNEYICYRHGETPYFKWDKNNEVYTTDTYDEVIVSDPDGGCDFKYRLDLKFHEEFYQEDWENACDTYTWPLTGETFTETGQIVRTFPHSFGDTECDSTYVLNLSFNYSPEADKIRCATEGAVVFSDPDDLEHNDAEIVAVITNTEFFSFQYTFRVKDSKHNKNECPWESCKWSIDNTNWYLDTIAGGVLVQNDTCYSECTVYVAEHEDEYAVLTAIMSNHCNSDTCKIYLKSSFLDTEEHEASPCDFSVVPNPNNGQMRLVFNRFDGKVDVKVYDVMGHLIDGFESEMDMGYQTLEYDLKGRKGVFFFVANGREGTVARKVIVR